MSMTRIRSKRLRRKRGSALRMSFPWLSAGKLAPIGRACITVAMLIIVGWGYAAVAADPPKLEDLAKQSADLKVGIDTMWVMFAGMLVFFYECWFWYVRNGVMSSKKRR